MFEVFKERLRLQESLNKLFLTNERTVSLKGRRCRETDGKDITKVERRRCEISKEIDFLNIFI